MRWMFAMACVVALSTGVARGADDTKPFYGNGGFDRSGMDPASKPGNDFFRYANGAWLDRTSIPGDKTEAGFLQAMNDRTEQQLHELIEAAAAHVGQQPSTVADKVGAFYRSFMDEARIDALGGKAIAPQLSAVRSANSYAAQAALMGRGNVDFDGSLFVLTTDVDLRDPKRYAVYVGQGGLGLPSRDYYLKPEFAGKKAAYQAYLVTLLKLVAWPDAEVSARDVVRLETAIAQASWSEDQQRSSLATYNKMSVAQLQRLAPGFAWSAYLQAAGLSDLATIVVGEKSAFPRLAALYAHTPLATLQAWQVTRIVDNAAVYLSRPFQDAHFQLHDRTLAGQRQPAPRWLLGVRATSGGDCPSDNRLDCFGHPSWAVGQLYTARYFPPAAKAKIQAMVTNIEAAYRARIEQLDWMSPATKQEALRKLATYTVKLGYPDHPRDYSKVDIRNEDLLGNVLRVAAADWAFNIGRLDGPVDRSEWTTSPQTGDPYNGNLRDIVFPAAVLQPPMFDPNADPAVNYGAIGAVIGHELTHGFDDDGRTIDADGALRDWWKPADARTFKRRAGQLAAQYSAVAPLPGVHINGVLTLGENIADLGGVTLAVDAYRASLHGAAAPVIDGLSGEQRLFLGWAQVWRGKLTDDALRGNIASSEHPPYAARVNGVMRNVDAWYRAFDVQPGDALYLAPEARVHIW
jgi:putative endopeptidase